VVVLVDEDHEGAPLVVADEAAVGESVEDGWIANAAESSINVFLGFHIGIVVKLDSIAQVALLAQLGLHTHKLTDLTLPRSWEGIKKNSLDCAHLKNKIK